MAAPRNPDCLHCHIVAAISTFYETRGERSDRNEVILPMGEVIAKLAEVTAGYIGRAGTREVRRRWEKYARTCLEQGFRWQRTGQPQEVAEPGAVAKLQ